MISLPRLGMEAQDRQGFLFDAPAPPVDAAGARPADRALAERLPAGVRLGTTSWSFPGWAGTVYRDVLPGKRLAARGLTAYAKHPVLRCVEIDRTYYEPLPASDLASYAAQVPEGFRFVVKAHEDCTVRRYPTHARYGRKKGEANPRYLDAAYAADAVVGPFREGLGARGALLLFQFPPQDAGEPSAFAAQLRAFLLGLPRGGSYAVEVRNEDLLTPAYAAALEEGGAVHCHNVWTWMPPILTQARLVPPRARRPLVVRWVLRAGATHEGARVRYEPFDRIVDEDPGQRATVADLVVRAQRHDVPAYVLVDNKAEGCAPESAVRLAAAIVERLGRGP